MRVGLDATSRRLLIVFAARFEVETMSPDTWRSHPRKGCVHCQAAASLGSEASPEFCMDKVLDRICPRHAVSYDGMLLW